MPGADVERLNAVISARDHDELERLLKSGASPQAGTGHYDPTPPLTNAVLIHDREAVRMLLRHSADPNGGSLGSRPLDKIGDSSEEHPDLLPILQDLLKAGADPHQANWRWIFSKGIDWANALLDAGLDVQREVGFETPIRMSATCPHREVFAAMLDRARPLDERDVYDLIKQAAEEDMVANIEEVRRRYPVPLRVDEVHRAARTGRAASLRYFLQGGLSPNAIHFEIPLLVQAAASESLESVEVLLGAGADTNLPGRSGVTPLMAAAREQNGDAIRVLVNAGADPTARDDFERTAVEHARAGLADTIFGDGGDAYRDEDDEVERFLTVLSALMASA